MRRKIGRIHFVGIGGIGMSGIAEILVRQGFEVTGSDLAKSPVTRHLESLGVTVWEGHSPEHVGEAKAVVYSSAVALMNPEVKAAQERGIPVIRRAEMLAELMRLKRGIGVAGTHGKTTTTSLVGTVLTEAGLDPTVIVGGVVRDLDTNARLGESELLVAEADEYDRSFLKLTPTLAVVTNLEAEHLDTYGTFENLREAFVHFVNSVPFYGTVILCGDEPGIVSLLPDVQRPVVTYGFGPQVDLRGVDVEVGTSCSCTVEYHGETLGAITVPLAGEHNLKNALAAVAVALELDVPFAKIADALTRFSGVRRRFDLRGEERGVAVYDDYAHHPTEVRATLDAARKASDRRVVGVFQPHLYSRTQTFYADFGRELLAADRLFITDVYPARETPIPGVTGELVVEAAKKFGHKHVNYVANRADLAAQIEKTLEGGELVITLGAGDIYKTSEELLALLKEGKREG
ncbi:UDP-N-acetylmuramate--L-alanine ligase [bacterium]|nr:UDP-N-acetylmuramate--L-alanine ligase [bacterium]